MFVHALGRRRTTNRPTHAFAPIGRPSAPNPIRVPELHIIGGRVQQKRASESAVMDGVWDYCLMGGVLRARGWWAKRGWRGVGKLVWSWEEEGELLGGKWEESVGSKC